MQNVAAHSLVSASNTDIYDLFRTGSEMRVPFAEANAAGSTTLTKAFFACARSSAIDLAKLKGLGFCVWSPGFSRPDERRVECSRSFHDPLLLDGPPAQAGTPCREGTPAASSQIEIFCNEFSISHNRPHNHPLLNESSSGLPGNCRRNANIIREKYLRQMAFEPIYSMWRRMKR
jgi:hypothetical protein